MSLEIRAHVNMELINFNSLKILKFKGFKMKNHTAISINMINPERSSKSLQCLHLVPMNEIMAQLPTRHFKW